MVRQSTFELKNLSIKAIWTMYIFWNQPQQPCFIKKKILPSMVKGINIVSNSILIPIDFLSLEFLLIDNRIYIKNWRRKLPSFTGRRTPFCTQAVSMLTPGCLRCYLERRMRLYPTNWTTPPSLTEFASVKLRDCGINIGIWKVGNRDNHAHCDRYVKLMSELGLFENKSAWGP